MAGLTQHPFPLLWIAAAASPSSAGGAVTARSQDVMGAVAEGPIVGALAPAQIERAGGLSNEAVRLKTCGLVGAIAEGLLGGAAAGAPEVCLSRLEGHLIGALLGANRFVGHRSSPALDPSE